MCKERALPSRLGASAESRTIIGGSLRDRRGDGRSATSRRALGLNAIRSYLLTHYPALGYPLYWRFWRASTASVGATQLVTLGQGWLVFELSGSPLDLGMLGAATAVPNILISFLGGALADRFDKRRILLGSCLIVGSLFALLALLDATGVVRVWHVLV